MTVFSFLKTPHWPHLSSLSILNDSSAQFVSVFFVSTASGALVVGGVRDICIDGWMDIPGDRFECSMEYNQSVSGSQWQSVVVCGSLW